jgi:hypothetical protein
MVEFRFRQYVPLRGCDVLMALAVLTLAFFESNSPMLPLSAPEKFKSVIVSFQCGLESRIQ